LDFLS
jgi:ferritin-like metal-binding protein YciE